MFEAVAGVVVKVIGPSAGVDFVYAIEVEPAVADQFILAQAVIIVGGVVEAEGAEGEIAAVIDQRAIGGGKLGVEARLGFALDLLDRALETLGAVLRLRGHAEQHGA